MSKGQETTTELLDYDSLIKEVEAYYGEAKPPGAVTDAELLDPSLLNDEIRKHHSRLPAGIIDLGFTDDSV